MKRFAFALALAAALPFAAQAAEFNQVQTDKSAITFGYQQMGVKMDGRFKKFAARLNFDPAKPADAKASFDVDLASVNTGAPEADEEVAGKPWFNTKAFPTAQFVSGSRQGARRQPLRSRRQADHQGQDPGHRRSRHLHGARQ